VGKKTEKRALLTVLAFAAFAGCDLMAARPPFNYGDAAIRVGPVAGYQERIGLAFALHNCSNKKITRLRVRFSLYDSRGQAVPDFGQNGLDDTLECDFPPGSDRNFISSLDRYFYYPPSGEYVAEEFRIPYLRFADGSEWRDSYDLFKRPGTISTEAIP
jgi:hypothetical protein